MKYFPNIFCLPPNSLLELALHETVLGDFWWIWPPTKWQTFLQVLGGFSSWVELAGFTVLCFWLWNDRLIREGFGYGRKDSRHWAWEVSPLRQLVRDSCRLPTACLNRRGWGEPGQGFSYPKQALISLCFQVFEASSQQHLLKCLSTDGASWSLGPGVACSSSCHL